MTHYGVEVSPDGNDPWTSQDDSITSNVYTHSGLSANDTRYYRVYAYNGAGQSPASTVVTVTIPTALQGATAGPPAEAELTGTATSWTHTGLIGNTTRYYRVRAENHIDEGGWSDPVSATTQAPGQADAPLNLSRTIAKSTGDG